MLTRLIALAVCLGGVSLAGVAVFVYFHAEPDPVPRAAAIVVLSGPGADVPGLEGDTRDRVNRGLELWFAGAAPLIVMSGDGDGSNPPGHIPHAEHMAAYARAQGIPGEAILMERNSGSTLHNAWFTGRLPEIDPAAPVIVVTQRYHLPRAWASFRWAGFSDITLAAPDSGGIELSAGLLWEGVKWP